MLLLFGGVMDGEDMLRVISRIKDQYVELGLLVGVKEVDY